MTVMDDLRIATSSSPPAVAMRGITKRFGEVVACDAIDL
jgi:ABC-type sugar transport system ATPase subunit